ncbi:hypothetical protein DFJ73DRAFT_816749 [Zopfochytrium polystomum]|nr:hypothetical protein DFJ73DRAFT_816749 [Zopfochytrium polystomum]
MSCGLFLLLQLLRTNPSRYQHSHDSNGLARGWTADRNSKLLKPHFALPNDEMGPSYEVALGPICAANALQVFVGQTADDDPA